jgi:hypothetical protein
MKKQFRHVILIVLLMMGILSGFNNVLASSEIPSFFVHHQTRGEQVLIECILTGISFRETDQSRGKIGKMVVWIDGKKKTEVNAAAFIIKDLSPGSHRVKLEVVNLNNETYGITKEFMVNISR